MKPVTPTTIKHPPLLTGQRLSTNESMFGGDPLQVLCCCYTPAEPDGSDGMAGLGAEMWDRGMFSTGFYSPRYSVHPWVTEECFYSTCTDHRAPLQTPKVLQKLWLRVKSRKGFWASALEASDNAPAYQALIREDARNTWRGLTPLTSLPITVGSERT